MQGLQQQFEEFTLDNGLHVMLERIPNMIFSGRLRVGFGALNELPGEEGLAHLLEHAIVTGGTEKYPPLRTDEARETICSFNAGTGLERLFLPVGSFRDDAELYIDFASDVAFHPQFDEGRLAEEKERVLRETADAKSNSAFAHGEAYRKAVFGAGSPHTYCILGNEDVVSNATPEQLRELQLRSASACNMDLILVGDLPSNVTALIEKSFGNKPRGEDTSVELPANPELKETTILHVHAPELLHIYKPQESSARLDIDIAAPPESADDSFAVRMLSAILGGDGSSRLMRRVSRREGLLYALHSDYDIQNNTGRIHIGGKIQSTKRNETVDVIFEEMRGLQERPVPERELTRAKRRIQYKIAETLQSNDGRVAMLEMRKFRGLTPESYMAGLDAVTPNDVQAAARAYLPDGTESGKHFVMMLRDPLKRV